MARASMTQDRSRRRLAWSFVASVCINFALFAAYPILQLRAREQPPVVVASIVRVDEPHPRRSPPPHRIATVAIPNTTDVARPATRTSRPEKTVFNVPGQMSFMPHRNARFRLPQNWSSQDLANGAAVDTSVWIDFKHARGAFVPTIFLVQLKTAYLSGPTLHDAVDDVVGALRPAGASIRISRPQRVCNGRLDGWFLAYEKANDSPPAQFESVMFKSGDKVFRLMYTRPYGQPADARAHAEFDAICPV